MSGSPPFYPSTASSPSKSAQSPSLSGPQSSTRPRRNTSSSFPFTLAFSDIDKDRDVDREMHDQTAGEEVSLGAHVGGDEGDTERRRDRAFSTSTIGSDLLSISSTPSLSTSVGSPPLECRQLSDREGAGGRDVGGSRGPMSESGTSSSPEIRTPPEGIFWLGARVDRESDHGQSSHVGREQGYRWLDNVAERSEQAGPSHVGGMDGPAELEAYEVIGGEYVSRRPNLWGQDDEYLQAGLSEDARRGSTRGPWDEGWSYGYNSGMSGKGKGRALDSAVQGELTHRNLIHDTRLEANTEDEEEAESPDGNMPEEMSNTLVLRREPSLESIAGEHNDPLSHRSTIATPTLASMVPRAPSSAVTSSVAGPRAQSIIMGDLPSTTASSVREASPASSVYPGRTPPSRTSGLKSKLQRSKSSFMDRMSGKEKNTSETDSARSVKAAVSPEGIAAGGRSMAPLDGEKGKVKGFVKKIMVRSKSSLSIPVSTPATTVIPASPIEIMDGGELGTLRISHSRPRAIPQHRPHLVKAKPPHRSLTSDGLGIWMSSSPSSSQEMIVRSHSEPLLRTGRPYFDTLLPQEIKVKILQSLVELHVTEHEEIVRAGLWCGSRAANTRWYGEAAGMRDIIKLGRVSKEWQELSLSGQIWANADMHTFLHHLSPIGLTMILRGTCAYTQRLNLYGWRSLPIRAIEYTLLSHGGDTQLRDIDIQGCLGLETEGLCQLIRQSPRLKIARFKASPAVNNIAVVLLRRHCRGLEELDISHCENAKPLTALAVRTRSGWPDLRILRIAGIATGEVLQELSKSAPALQVLDISYSRDITDNDIKAFVAVDPIAIEPRRWRSEGPDPDLPISYLRPAVAGQSAAGFTCGGLVPRRITKIRHFSMSSCPHVSDASCKYLANAVPDLQILEAANIGPKLKDAGLIALIEACPKLRVLDLEGAKEITDTVLLALVPPKATGGKLAGHAGLNLERLAIGFAGEITNAALIKLVLNCPKLTQLVVDNTAAADSLVKVSVRKAPSLSILSVVDCRQVSRIALEAMEQYTRPRNGWRGWEAGPLGYQEGHGRENTRDECVDMPVVQSFWTWSKVPGASLAPGGPAFKADGVDQQGGPAGVFMNGPDRQCIVM